MALSRILSAALLALAPPCVVGAAEAPTNLVLIVADDLGYGELTCQNADSDVPTPRIDSIARDGARLTDAYVTATYCAPSRAGLATGRYQTRFGFEFNPTGARNEEPDAWDVSSTPWTPPEWRSAPSSSSSATTAGRPVN